MLFRNVLLAIGALSMLAGLGMSLLWLSQLGPAPDEAKHQPQQEPAPQPQPLRHAIMKAAHPLAAGTLLRPADFHWREAGPGEMRPGMIQREETTEAEYTGAIIRKDFADGEPLTAADLLKTTDRYFLSAVLQAGTRAVTIAVDAPQGSSGMVLPGDRVDVVLTQNFNADNDLSHKTVAETVLRNVRVIAVDQQLKLAAKLAPPPEAAPEPQGVRQMGSKEPAMPRTVTLELTERQAEKLYVAAQLGGLHLPVRPLESSADAPSANGSSKPTWASDASPALRQVSRPQQPQGAPASTVEAAVRRPPQAF